MRLRRLLAGVILSVAASAPLAAQTLVVVVHPSNSATSVTKAELSRIFLKRLRTWSDGERAMPVDQIPGPLRELFSRTVHDRSMVNVEVYWKRMIFSGRDVPPVEVAEDEAVLDFVRSTPGAVGYVTSKAELKGVRALRVEE